MRVLYLLVTPDKYELPLVVAGSVTELAEVLGVSVSAVCKGIKRYYTGERKTQYRKVIVDD